mgnify:CR=1 FL=1
MDNGVQNLFRQPIGAAAPKVDVADVQQAARIRLDRQTFLADVQIPGEPELERAAGMTGHKGLYNIKYAAGEPWQEARDSNGGS